MTPREKYNKALADQLIPRMEKRHFEVSYCPTKEDAFQKALSYFKPGDSIGWGGSESLLEMGLLDYLRNEEHPYTIYDRDLYSSPEDKAANYARTVNADYFLMSSNAVTLDGELVNIDGAGGRVACLCFGPKNVLVVVSLDKVVKGAEAAMERVRNVAGPINAARLNRNTPCTKLGSCASCLSDDCICSQLVTTRNSGIPGRIKVILVGEKLGY